MPSLGRSRRRCRSTRCADLLARLGRDPRLAQRRVILFFWPMRASSGEPDFYVARHRRLFRARFRAKRAGSFFKILDGASRLSMMARPSRKLAIAHRAQLAAQRLLGDGDRGILRRSIGKDRRSASARRHGWRGRTVLDHARERGAMCVVQPRRLAGRLAVEQAIRAMRVEPQHPVADDLERRRRRFSPPRCAARRHRSPRAPEAVAPAARLSCVSLSRAKSSGL